MERHIDKKLFLYMLLTYLTGTAAATFVPVMSIFLQDGVGASPFQIGCYFTCAAIAGIVVTQVLAKFSDGRLSRRLLIVIGGLSGMCAAFVLIAGGLLQCYWLILVFGVLFLSFSGLSTPQVFASAREYAIEKSGKSVMFTMYMRACFAFAWVIAPPLAYIIAVKYGFSQLFIFTSVFFLLVAVIGWLGIPATSLGGIKGDANDKDLQSQEKIGVFSGGVQVWKDVGLLFIAVTLLWTCNNAYLISMPIYVRDELGLSKELPGVMMASAALMEIPVMLLAGKLSAKFGVKNLQLVSAIGGLLFYIVFRFMPHDTSWYFMAVQFFNAVFIGILAGLGMVYFQELLPKIPGQATTLFSNAVNTGAILSGLVVGTVASVGSYQNIFALCMLFSSIALALLFFVRKV